MHIGNPSECPRHGYHLIVLLSERDLLELIGGAQMHAINLETGSTVTFLPPSADVPDLSNVPVCHMDLADRRPVTLEPLQQIKPRITPIEIVRGIGRLTDRMATLLSQLDHDGKLG